MLAFVRKPEQQPDFFGALAELWPKVRNAAR
jgi:hypothetical protein